MAPKALTVVAPVKPGREQALREVLAQMKAQDASGGDGTNAVIRFCDGTLTHLANFVILDDADHGPRLCFSSNYDGKAGAYLDELTRIGRGMDALWSNCEGYGGPDDFPRFIRRWSYPWQSFFIGFRMETVQSIRDKVAVREMIQDFLGLRSVLRYLDHPGIEPFLNALSRLAGRPRAAHPVARALRAVKDFLHRLFFGVVIAFAKWYGSLIVNDRFTSPAANLDQKDPGNLEEDLSNEDQMTNLIDVKPFHRLWLRVVLFYLQFLGRFAFPPGHLAGVVTIHFARWVMVDGGRRLLFQSKFDGSWENYMGDFVDKVDWGLDACWMNTIGYPTAGMKDIDSFKRFIRDRQFPFLYVYNAYPKETVLNLIRDRAVVDPLTAGYDRHAVESWLRQL